MSGGNGVSCFAIGVCVVCGRLLWLWVKWQWCLMGLLLIVGVCMFWGVCYGFSLSRSGVVWGCCWCVRVRVRELRVEVEGR